MNNDLVLTGNGTVTAAARTIESVVSKFLSSQDVRESSRSLYSRTIKQFFAWLKNTARSLSNLQRADIIQYKENLLKAGKSVNTVASYITVVRRFFSFVEGEKIYPDVAKNVKNPRLKQQFYKEHLNIEQTVKLLGYFKTQSLRDYAIVNLLVRCGLRTVEAVRANVGDITYKNGIRVLLVQGKGHDSKDDFVVLTDEAYTPIADYLETRGNVLSGSPLFTSESDKNFGERLETQTISKTVKRGLRAIGIDDRRYTAHSLRHTTAFLIDEEYIATEKDDSAALSVIQRTLRHSNPATTQIYMRSFREEKQLRNNGENRVSTLLKQYIG